MNRILLFWFLFSAICYRLREIPHIWSKSANYRLRYKWMLESRWFTNSSPRSDSWFRNLTGLNTFDDAYHFFGNLPRIFLGNIIGFEYGAAHGWFPGMIYGLIAYFLWWVGSEVTMYIFVIKEQD